jgi:hypothetical protein
MEYHLTTGACIFNERHAACSFRWFTVAESTVRWFIVREKYYWIAADSAE